MIQSAASHVVASFIAAEDSPGASACTPQHDLDEFLAERPGPAGYRTACSEPFIPFALSTKI